MVVAAVPDGPPARVRYDGAVHAVLWADGPDCLEPEWWREPEERPGRDYYRVALASGARLWIGRARLPAPTSRRAGSCTAICRDAAFAEVGARSNFTLLEGASHPAELVATAKALGHAGIGVCDTNSLAGVVRAHVAAKEIGLPSIVGARLVLEDGASYFAWPTDRDSYGRLTRLLSLGKMRAPKGMCQIGRDDLIEPCQRLGDGGHPPCPAGCRLRGAIAGRCRQLA